MAELTIQQAYALALGAYQSIIKTAPSNINYSFSIAGAFTNETHPTLGDLTKQNRLQALLSTQQISLPAIPTTTSPTGNTPTADRAYTLVTTSTDSNSDAIPDYLQGASQLIGNTGTLSIDEKNYHLTGLGIMSKLKK